MFAYTACEFEYQHRLFQWQAFRTDDTTVVKNGFEQSHLVNKNLHHFIGYRVDR